jgi:predicted  nucleic acid-binding Zn-ribbon protein
MFQTETEIYIENNNYKQLYEKLREKCARQEEVIASLQKDACAPQAKVRSLSNWGYDFFTNLQYKVKALTGRVNDFESGEKYIKMQADYKSQISARDREIKNLKHELAETRVQVTDVRNRWMQANEDLVNEHAKALLQKDRKIAALEKQLLDMQIALDAEKEKFRDKVRELYQVKTELEDEKGRNQKLVAQINRDYENSSIPSSLKPNRKKIVNNRVKTGKKPGGQVGHKGHLRKKLEPTNKIDIPAPDKYTKSPDFRPTGRIITKQVISIKIDVIVDEYTTPEFRNVRTGQRVHAEFPDGVVNDVNYNGDVKAFAFLLNNRCNVSIEKVSDLIADLTGGKLTISAGMINGLAKEFSEKTEEHQKKAFSDILLSPVMNVDLTPVRVNGKNMQVVVCATPSAAMYFAREHKGHESVKGTPIEHYQQAMVHDHDITFYSYGRFHQECLEHVLRYLLDSIENEPNLKWNKMMRELIREMIHFRNGLKPDETRNPDEVDPGKVKEFEAMYDKILKLAEEEYEYEPPNKYYMDGFKLFKKLRKYRNNHLLFLHDIRVPPTNNLAKSPFLINPQDLPQSA